MVVLSNTFDVVYCNILKNGNVTEHYWGVLEHSCNFLESVNYILMIVAACER